MCIEKGITKIAFDRGGYKYHGRVAALADALREGRLQEDLVLTNLCLYAEGSEAQLTRV